MILSLYGASIGTQILKIRNGLNLKNYFLFSILNTSSNLDTKFLMKFEGYLSSLKNGNP